MDSCSGKYNREYTGGKGKGRILDGMTDWLIDTPALARKVQMDLPWTCEDSNVSEVSIFPIVAKILESCSQDVK